MVSLEVWLLGGVCKYLRGSTFSGLCWNKAQSFSTRNQTRLGWSEFWRNWCVSKYQAVEWGVREFSFQSSYFCVCFFYTVLAFTRYSCLLVCPFHPYRWRCVNNTFSTSAQKKTSNSIFYNTGTDLVYYYYCFISFKFKTKSAEAISVIFYLNILQLKGDLCLQPHVSCRKVVLFKYARILWVSSLPLTKNQM